MHATYEELYLGLLKLVSEVKPDMAMVIRGTPAPQLSSLDEWISFELLSLHDLPARVDTVYKVLDIQLTCYARHGTLRADKRFGAHFGLADVYGKVFHKRNIQIKNTCIQFKENRMVPLDLRSTGDYAAEITNSLPQLHTQSVVILNQGIISSTVEG